MLPTFWADDATTHVPIDYSIDLNLSLRGFARVGAAPGSDVSVNGIG